MIDRQGNPVEGVHYVANERFNRQVASSWNRIRPRSSQFPYHDRADDELVKQIEQSKNYIQERSDAAVGLEYAVMEGIHNGAWLGVEAAVTPASKYDDLVNHIDAVVTIQEGDQSMYLGLDITSSDDYAVIERKLMQTTANLKQGKLTTIKYYINDESGDKREISAPRVVIAVTSKATRELVDGMVEHPQNIPVHPIQLDILDEALEQLSVGLEAVEKQKATPEVQEAYRRLVDYLTGLKQKKSLQVVRRTYGQAPRETISVILSYHRQYLGLS